MSFRVVCVGLAKTGTTSLQRALCALGIPTVHNPRVSEQKIEQAQSSNLPIFANFDSETRGFTDSPFWLREIYLEILQQYPETRFIWTRREKTAWLKSYMRMSERRAADPDFTGVVSTRAEIEQEWEDQQREIPHDFRHCPHFLELELTGGNHWQPLCDFLGIREIPQVPFPHVNINGSHYIPIRERASFRQQTPAS